MLTRRKLVLAASAPLVANACTPATGTTYEDTAQQTWQVPAAASVGTLQVTQPLLRELVRVATLAPSSHNTQCWRFAVADTKTSGKPGMVWIAPDLSRRCPAVDPDDHHLFVSLGCATENLAQAAQAQGFVAQAVLGAADVIQISLQPTAAVTSPLYAAMAQRQCTRGEYDGKALPVDDLRLLQAAVKPLGTSPGVQLLLITDKPKMEQVLAQVIAANTVQMDDPAFVAELKSWIRFNDAQALRTGDGLFSRASGNPAIPPWLGSALFPLFFKASSENDKYAKQVRSSAGIAVFTSEALVPNEPFAQKAHWIATGRAYQRFALQATALGIRTAFLNQPVEVVGQRAAFATAWGLGQRRPDLVVRFGRGPLMPRSLRRPVDAVLVAAPTT
jgi:hypothetical protein